MKIHIHKKAFHADALQMYNANGAHLHSILVVPWYTYIIKFQKNDSAQHIL